MDIDCLSDSELVARFCLSADDACFQAIVRRHSAVVTSVCSTVLRDTNDVDDAFQATFVIFFRYAKKIRNRESLAAWLHKVALRCAFEVRKKNRRKHGSELPLDDMVAARELERISSRAIAYALHDEIDRLPVRYRTAMVAFYFQGLDQHGAAEQLGISPITLRKRLERGRAKLRRRLAKLGFSSVALSALPRLVSAGTAGYIPGVSFASEASVAMSMKASLALPWRWFGAHRGLSTFLNGRAATELMTIITCTAALFVTSCAGFVAASAETLGHTSRAEHVHLDLGNIATLDDRQDPSTNGGWLKTELNVKRDRKTQEASTAHQETDSQLSSNGQEPRSEAPSGDRDQHQAADGTAMSLKSPAEFCVANGSLLGGLMRINSIRRNGDPVLSISGLSLLDLLD